MKSRTSLLIAAAFQIFILQAQPAQADLGAAETAVNSSTFNAFCAKPGNNCKVIFDRDRMRIDESDGITRSQVLRIWQDEELRGFWDRTPGDYYYPVYYISYRKSDGSDSTAKFIFINWDAGRSFWNALNIFTGPERREIGPNIQLEIKQQYGPPTGTSK